MSHRSPNAGIRKVRKARTIVMVLLVAVAVTIILIDRKEEEETPMDLSQMANLHTETQLSTNLQDTSVSVNTQTNNSTQSVPQEGNTPVRRESVNNVENISLQVPQRRIRPEHRENSFNTLQRSRDNSVSTQRNRHTTIVPQEKTKKRSPSDKKSLKKDTSRERVAYHIVKPGETLSAISHKHYGKASFWQAILSANSISDERFIRPGQKLLLPEKKRLKKLPQKMAYRKSRNKKRSYSKRSHRKKSTVHVVRKGDTLSKISKTFGVSVVKIYDANRKILKNPHFLKPGETIRIPEPMAKMNR